MLNRLTKEIDPLGFETSYVYDALGNLASRLEANGTLLQYQYQVNLLEAILDGDGNVLSQWTYDSLGRRQTAVNADVSLEYQYDQLSRPSAVINHTLAKTLDYTYDANGNREVMVGPKGPIEYFYDARNQLVEMRDPATGTYRFEYDALGRRTRLAYPNGVDTRYTYDAASRLLTLITSNSQGEILDGYAYTYDAYGNRVTMRNLRNEIDDTYQYDTLNRLVRWERGSDRFEAYTYDNVGNRTRLEDENGTVTYTYDNGDRLLTEVRTRIDGSVEETVYGWDAVGQMVSREVGEGVTTLSWNDLGRLSEWLGPEGSTEILYSPEGLKSGIATMEKAGAILHDPIGKAGFDSTLEVVASNGEGIDHFVPGARPDEQLGVHSSTSVEESITYYHHDGLGSITLKTDQLGNTSSESVREYSPFGSIEPPSEAIEGFGYSGRELDGEGLMYYRSRYYQPSIGRFLSEDSFYGALGRPKSQNRYTYVEGNPVTFTDPSGHTRVAVGLMVFWVGLRGLLGIFQAAGKLIGQGTGQWARLRERQREAAEDPFAYTRPPGFFHETALALFHGSLLSIGVISVGLYFYAWGYAGAKLIAHSVPAAGGVGPLGRLGETLAKTGLGLSGSLATQYILLLGSCAYNYVDLVESEGSFLAFGDFAAYCVLFSTLFLEMTLRSIGPRLR